MHDQISILRDDLDLEAYVFFVRLKRAEQRACHVKIRAARSLLSGSERRLRNLTATATLYEYRTHT